MRPPKATPIPADYEDRHRLALVLCEHLGINPEHVLLGSLQIELGPDARHRVTWTGHAHLNHDNLTALILKARDDQPLDEPDCPATTPAIYGTTHPDVPHRCHLANGHTYHHQCGICATLWEPNPT